MKRLNVIQVLTTALFVGSLLITSCNPTPPPFHGKWGLTDFYDSILINKAFYKYSKGFYSDIILDFDMFGKDTVFIAGQMDGGPYSYKIYGMKLKLKSSDFATIVYNPQTHLLTYTYTYDYWDDTMSFTYRHLNDSDNIVFDKNLIPKLFEGNYTRIYPKDNKTFTVKGDLISGFDKTYRLDIWRCDETYTPFAFDALFLIDTIDDITDMNSIYNWKWNSDSLILRYCIHGIDSSSGFANYKLGDRAMILKKLE